MRTPSRPSGPPFPHVLVGPFRALPHSSRGIVLAYAVYGTVHQSGAIPRPMPAAGACNGTFCTATHSRGRSHALSAAEALYSAPGAHCKARRFVEAGLYTRF